MAQMNKIVRELCRLALNTDLSSPRIASLLKCHPGTVRRYRTRLDELGLTWQAIERLNDVQILARI